MINKFWTNEHNELVRQFINDKDNRNNTFNKLSKVLNRIIDIVSYEMNCHNDEDFRQDCLLRLYVKILPAIHEDKLVVQRHAPVTVFILGTAKLAHGEITVHAIHDRVIFKQVNF